MSLISDLRNKLEQLEQASITAEYDIKSSILHILGLYNKTVEPITEINATIKPTEVMDIADTPTGSHFTGQNSIADTKTDASVDIKI